MQEGLLILTGSRHDDEVLVEVARRLRSTVAADDLVVRWGGEEFLVVLPGADGARTGWMAQQLLQETGPLAVSSANRTGMTAAVTAEQAREILARFSLRF